MPVSQAELRLLITAQDRAKHVVEGAAQTIGRVTQAVNQLGSSRGFQVAADGARQLGSAINSMSRGNPFGAMTQGAQQFARAMQQAAQQSRSAGQVDFLSGGQQRGQAAAAGLNSALSNIQAAFQKAQQQAAQASGAIGQSLMQIGNAARGAAGGVSGGLSAAFNGLSSLVGGVRGVAGSITSLTQSTSGLQGAAQNVNTLSGSLRNMVALGATIVGLQGAVALLTSMFDGIKDAAIGFNSVLENTQNAFTSLFKGDATKAAAFIQQLRQVAESTAFEFPDLLKMSQQLVGVGLAAEQVIPLMKDVAGAMTAAGRTTADVNRVSRALQQIFTTGRVQADEMNQLAEAGVPGWTILGQAIQKSGESIESAIGRARELGKQGKISAADFFNAFQAYSKTAGWREMAENAVNTFTGAISNLKDSFRFLISDATAPAFQAMSTGIQAFSKLLMSTPVRQFALDVGATMKDVIASFAPVAQAFGRIFEGFKANGISGVLTQIVAEFAGLATDMQSAGAQLMVEYASGIMQGASDAIQAAVDFVADLIASYLIGNSPPDQGPLAQIATGGKNVGMAYAAGLREGVQDIEGVAVQVADAFGNIGKSLSLDQVQAAFEGAKGSLMGLGQVAEDVEGALRSLNDQQRELDQQQGNLQSQQENIKSYYGDQIDSLDQIIEGIKEQNTEAEKYADLIQKQSDAISRQADLRDRAALNELKAAEIAAEGDPVKRAALIAQQQQLKAREQDLQLAQKQHDLDQRQEALNKRKSEGKSGGATDAQDIALAQQRIDLDREQLKVDRDLAGLTDKTAMANIEAQRAEINRAAALRKVNEDRARMATEAVQNAADIERAERAILALPYEQQLEAIKKQQEAALKPIERRLTALQQEERQLQNIRKEWQAIKSAINDAEQAQKATEKAGKAGKGPGFAGGPLNLDRQEIDVAAAAERIGHSFAGKFGEAVGARIGPIMFGILGGVLGGAMFGPLGLAAGAAFGAQVGAGVQSRVPELSTIIGDMGRTFLEAFAGQWSTDHGGEWVSPIVDAAGRVGIAFRFMADTIAEAWNFIKGPVQAGAEWIKQNSGLAAAALTGLLVPAFSILLSTVGAVVAPIIALLAPLTPAILAVSAAAVLLKLAWDANFGGIQQTVAAAIPGIIESLKLLGTAFQQLSQGDYAGALSTLGAALQRFGAAVAPILQGIGQAIWDQTKLWAVALWEWIKGATPLALAALADFANAAVAWVGQNAEPFLRALLEWGKGFLAWIGPMIPPVIVALGTLVDNILTWIGAQIPGLVQAITKWSVIFVGWIVTDVLPQLPGLLAMLGELIIAGIVTLVPRVAESVLAIAIAIGTGFMEGLAEAAPGVHQALLDLWAMAVSAWDTAVATVQAIVQGISDAWNALPALLQAIWDAIANGVTTAITAVQTAWDTGWKALQAAWNAIGAAILAAVMAVWNSLSEDTRTSITAMVASIQALWQSIQTLATALWAAIQQIFSTALAFLTQLVTGWIAASLAQWTALSTSLQALWTTLTGYASAAWTAITGAITAIVTSWWQQELARWNAIIAAVQAAWEILKTTLGPIIEAALKIVTDRVLAFFETAKGWATTMGEFGKAMAEAFGSFLKSVLEAKIKEVTDFVKGAVDGIRGIIDGITGWLPGSGGGGQGNGTPLSTMSFRGGGAGGNGPIDPQAVARANFNIDPSKGRDSVLQQWAPVLDAIEKSGGPLARNIAAIILAENGGGNSDLVRRSKNWFSIQANPNRPFQNGTDEGGRFAKYKTDADAIADFLDLIMNNARYAEAWNSRRGSPDQWTRGLAKGGYIAEEPGFPISRWIQNVGAGANTYDEATRNMPAIENAVANGVARGMNAAGRVPVVQNALASSYWTSGGTHGGSPAADIFAPKGSPIFAPVNGISRPGKFALGGEATIIEGEDGKFYYMAHGNVPFKGGRVKAGEQIGEVGNTGNAAGTDPHLHYAIATNPNVFNTRNGSGDINGTPADWIVGGGRRGPTGNPMGAGGMGEAAAILATFPGLAKAAQDAITQMGTATEAAGQQSQAGATTQQAAVQGTLNVLSQATAANTTYADVLSGKIPAAGAAAGTSLQQMTAGIDPLIQGIATGTLTTDQLVLKLAELAANAGLTDGPLRALQAGSTDLTGIMQTLFAIAAQLDPQFAALATQFQGTNATAQEMANTFAQGVANSTGNASAAMAQMQASIDPVLASVAAGQQEGALLEQTLTALAAATGLTTAPFRQLSDGAIDSNTALKQVIDQARAINPEFGKLAEEVDATGTVSREAALKFLELIKAFKAAKLPATQAADAAAATGDEVQGAVPAVNDLATALGTAATDAAAQFQAALEQGIAQAIEAVKAQAENAKAAGTEVGTAISDGMTEGIQSAAEKVGEAAAQTVRDAIEKAKGAADSQSPSKKTMELGRNISEGLVIGQEQASGKAVAAAGKVTGRVIQSMQGRARAHSPSEETRELGWNMNAGLEQGQTEDSRYVDDAARSVIDGALTAMRDEAGAHSPATEGVRIGEDIMKGLIKGLQSGNLSEIARQQIQDYIKVAANFADDFAKQVDIGVAKLQHEIAGKQRENLEATMAVADWEAVIERASKGTLENRIQIARIGVTEAQVQNRLAQSAVADLQTQTRLRDVQQERDRIAKGSLPQQQEMARLGMQMAQIGSQTARLDLQSAQAAKDSLPIRQELASLETQRADAAKGSLGVQLRQAEIGRRTQEIALEQSRAERDLLPVKAQARDLQRQIESATKGSLAAQQQAIRTEAQQAASRIDQLRIQQQLADAEDTGGGLTQEQINALHERDRALQRQSETNSRQAEIEKLQATITTAADRERLLALQDQIAQREQALLPVQDEKALLDNENQIIQGNLALTAAGYDSQILQIQAQVAQHDALATRLDNERAALDAQTAILTAQQGIITATNEAAATALDERLVLLQSETDQVAARQQYEQDTLDILSAQRGEIEAALAVQTAGFQEHLEILQENLYVQESGQRVLERQLQIQQAIANVISTQVSLANALKSALEAAGIIKDKSDSSSSGSSKKKKKKKAAGGPVNEDDIVLVGELGPEIFVPPTDGTILNNATTERLMSALDIVSPRIDGAVRQRQVGGTVWGGRSYMTGERGTEGFKSWSPSGGDPDYQGQPTKVVNATVHYHVHEQQRSGEARVERVVYEAVQYAMGS